MDIGRERKDYLSEKSPERREEKLDERREVEHSLDQRSRRVDDDEEESSLSVSEEPLVHFPRCIPDRWLIFS